MSDWKQHHANEAEKAQGHQLVEDVVAEFVGNVKRNRGVDLSDGLASYGLSKCLSVAMQVARAEALGVDPALLKFGAEGTAEEFAHAERVLGP